jgi:hypothetical protein
MSFAEICVFCDNATGLAKCSFNMWLSPTPDSDCGIRIWGIGLFLCELRFLLVLPLVPVRDVTSFLASFRIWIKWKCKCFNYDQHLVCFCHTCICKILFKIMGAR